VDFFAIRAMLPNYVFFIVNFLFYLFAMTAAFGFVA